MHFAISLHFELMIRRATSASPGSDGENQEIDMASAFLKGLKLYRYPIIASRFGDMNDIDTHDRMLPIAHRRNDYLNKLRTCIAAGK